MRTKKLETIIIGVIFVVSLLLIYGNYTAKVFLDEPLTPGAYGMLVSGILAVLCIIKLIQNITREFKNKSNDDEIVLMENKKIVFIQIILAFLYAYGALNIGYSISSLIYTFVAFILLVGAKEIKQDKKIIIKLFIISLVLVGALYYLFKVAKVFLPNTPLI